MSTNVPSTNVTSVPAASFVTVTHKSTCAVYASFPSTGPCDCREAQDPSVPHAFEPSVEHYGTCVKCGREDSASIHGDHARTPVVEESDAVKRGKRVTELLKIVEDAGEELIMIEFQDKARGVERFKRMQQLAEDIQSLHRLMASRVKDAISTDYGARVCTTADLAAGFGLGRNGLLAPQLGGVADDAVSMLREMAMTQTRQGDDSNENGRREALSAEVSNLIAAKVALPPNGTQYASIDKLLDQTLKELEALHGNPAPVEPAL